MATAKDLRELALALEGTSEAPHFDRAAFRVKRIYATLAADGLSANLMLTPDEQDFHCMLRPHALKPLDNAWGRNGATMLTLAALSREELGSLLEVAWRHAVPAKRAKSR